MGTTRLFGVRGVLAAALLLAVVMVVLAAGSADAAFPGQDGKIAFSKENYRNGTSGIFAIAPEGGGQERLGPEYGYSPSWSADGQKIAFARYTRNSADIFTKTIGVSGSTRLTDNPAFEDSVAVSPDGGKIAFTRYNRNSESSDIYVMNADGTGTKNLTKTDQIGEFGSDWSPDGGKIAFTSVRFSGMEGLAARAAESQEGGAFTPEALTLESLAREASEPKETTAEPEEDVEVSVINADGTGREDLTASRAYDILPAFSPSGDEIVFSKLTFDGRSEQSELVVMDSDGTNKRQITDTPRAFEYEADWQPLLLATP